MMCLNVSRMQRKERSPFFDPPAQIQTEGAFYDLTNACFTDSHPTLYDNKKAYQTKLAEYLADLACEDPFIAEGLSERADYSEDNQLAAALLEKTKACPNMNQVQ
jgi:hypothetical protein